MLCNTLEASFPGLEGRSLGGQMELFRRQQHSRSRRDHTLFLLFPPRAMHTYAACRRCANARNVQRTRVWPVFFVSASRGGLLSVTLGPRYSIVRAALRARDLRPPLCASLLQAANTAQQERLAQFWEEMYQARCRGKPPSPGAWPRTPRAALDAGDGPDHRLQGPLAASGSHQEDHEERRGRAPPLPTHAGKLWTAR